MKTHVKKEDLEGFLCDTILFAQHGRGINKVLKVIVDPVNKRIWYELKDKKQNVFSGPSLDEAIQLYNLL